MTLTVGTTLQNDEIIIEAILHQSDFGVTYQATHVSLNRPIVLQSFNESVRQRSDFDQLRQKFLQEVLIVSKQPSETVAIVDCFEENTMPFVVLTPSDDCAIPHLSDWFEIPVEAIAPVEAPVEAPPESAAPEVPSDEAAIATETPRPTEAEALAAALATAFPDPPEAVATVETTPEIAPEIALAIAPETAPKSEELVLIDAAELPIAAPELQPLKNGVTVFVSEPSPKPKKLMPLALMMTALITGFGGIGLGLALRFEPTPKADSNSSGLNSGWFGREQNFPPQQEWPITETPNLYPPTSTFEQPYQPSPPLTEYSTPSLQPAPDYIPPAQLPAPTYPSVAPPRTADYPSNTPDPLPDSPAPIVEPPPEAAPPEIPLPEPITPDAPLDIAPEAAPADPKNAPPDEPIIFQQ
jgi:hypothetical protein